MERSVYRSAPWLHSVWILFALVGIFCLWRSFTFSAIQQDPGVIFFRSALCGWMLMAGIIGAYTLRSRVVLDPKFVSVRDLFRERVLRRDLIETARTGSKPLIVGWMLVSVKYLILATEGPHSEELNIASTFRFDEVWDEWIETLKNLDEKQEEIQTLF